MSHADPYSTRRREALHNAVLIAWISYAVGLLTSWVTGPIGFIIALVKRGDAIGTIYESHFAALIRSGIIVFIGYAVGWVLTPVLIGFPILILTFVYNLYVVVRGLLRLSERRPYD